MIQNKISQYVRTMFDESRDGELTVGNDDDRFDCPVAWDEQTAEKLAEQCGALLAHLTELAGQHDKLKIETRHLTQDQLDKLHDAFRGIDPRVINPGTWFNKMK
jgi:hypothetical protein